MPKPTYDLINDTVNSGVNLVYNDDFYQILSSIILRDKDNLTDYFEVNEGIENKIYNSIFKCQNIEELQNEIKSKRYTMTKISRTLNNIMLGIKRDDILKTKDLKEMPYVRVLAFNDKGCEILKEIKKNSEIEVITKFSKIKHIDSDIFNTLINYDIKATNMYSLIYNKSLLKGPMDYITSPKYINNIKFASLMAPTNRRFRCLKFASLMAPTNQRFRCLKFTSFISPTNQRFRCLKVNKLEIINYTQII